MESIKYIYIPTSSTVREERFYVGFQMPESDAYFFMARQSCKKVAEHADNYLTKIDLKNKYNHKLLDLDTDENVGVISDQDIYSFFEECTNSFLISSIFSEKTSSKKEVMSPDVEDLVIRMEIMEKEIEILKLKIKSLEK